MAQEIYEQTFAITAPARLALGNIRGPIIVQPGAAGQVTVTAVKHTDSGDAARTQVAIAQDDDGTVRAETHFQKAAGLLQYSKPCRVEYTVRVPGPCALEASNVEGTLKLSGLEGAFDLNNVSGDVALSDLSGVVRVQTVSGAVRGERLRLDQMLTFETVSGDVRLTECDLPAVHGSTVSGAVTTDTPLGAGPYAFHSVSGHVRMRVPGEAACTVVMKTLSGRLRTDLPARGGQRRRGRARLNLNGGGTPIRLESVSGDLSIVRAV
jgi:hypothetical protein